MSLRFPAKVLLSSVFLQYVTLRLECIPRWDSGARPMGLRCGSGSPDNYGHGVMVLLHKEDQEKDSDDEEEDDKFDYGMNIWVETGLKARLAAIAIFS